MNQLQSIAERTRLESSLQEWLRKESPVPQAARKPGHRVKFQWPPHPISYSFHVLASDWSGATSLTVDDESFEVRTARTPHGLFGRCDALWLEARGETEEEMLAALTAAAQPLFSRQQKIANVLGLAGRFKGNVRSLDPFDLLRLLYCEDRDVANDAQLEIESHARGGNYTSALVSVLLDRAHPNRRSAQWCVLDMFEDLPSFTTEPEDATNAINAIAALLMDAEDDYARTVFKAGVVLGGHIPDTAAGDRLITALESQSRIGRRAAIHGLFHLAEWSPERRHEVESALRAKHANDPEPSLRWYAGAIADDVAAGHVEHAAEPMFDTEP